MSPYFEPDALHHGFVEDSKDNPCWLQEIIIKVTPWEVMTYERLGAFFPSSLAFRATLLLKYAVSPFTFQLKPSNEQYSCSSDTDIRCNRHTFGLIKISEDSRYIWNIPYPHVHDLDEKYVCLVYKDVKT